MQTSLKEIIEVTSDIQKMKGKYLSKRLLKTNLLISHAKTNLNRKSKAIH